MRPTTLTSGESKGSHRLILSTLLDVQLSGKEILVGGSTLLDRITACLTQPGLVHPSRGGVHLTGIGPPHSSRIGPIAPRQRVLAS